MKRLTVLLAGAAGMLLAPAAAQASVNVAWSPQTGGGSFDFGTVKITQALGQRFRLTNTGATRTPTLGVGLSGAKTFGRSRDTCSGKRLAPGGTCTVWVTYTPATDGQTSATTLIARDKRHPRTVFASIGLSGTARGTADLEWSGSSHDFGSTPGTFQITVTNVGTAAAFVTNGGGGSLPGALYPDRFCAEALTGTSLPPGGSCTETWTFTPSGCTFSGPLDVQSAVGPYDVDSTHTTQAGPAVFELTATCP